MIQSILLLLFAFNGPSSQESFTTLGMERVFGEETPLTGEPGSFTLIDGWASWCPPCLDQFSARAQLQETYGSKRLRLIAVTEEEAAFTKLFVGRMPLGLKGTVLVDRQHRLSQLFRARGLYQLPRTLILDHQAQIVWMGDPRGTLDKLVAELMSGIAQVEYYQQMEETRRQLVKLLQMVNGPSSGMELLAAGEAAAGLQVEARDQGLRSQILNAAAWDLLTKPANKGRFVDQAVRLAEAGCAAVQYRDPAVLDTYALATFESGDAQKALALQRQALKLTDDPTYYEALNIYLKALNLPAETPPVAVVRPNVAENHGKLTTLTQAQARADLTQAHALLRDTYAGYSEIGWQLRARGSSWEARLNDGLTKIEQQPAWSATAFFGLVRHMLEPISDAHFYIQGPDLGDGQPRDFANFNVAHKPFFTDVRVRRDAIGLRIVETPAAFADLKGSYLSDLPVVVPAFELGQAYLLPTLPGVKGAEDYLVGAFYSSTPSQDLTLEWRTASGEKKPVSLPLHRGRFSLPQRRQAGFRELGSPEVPIATLQVTTCDSEQIAGLADTAVHLRSRKQLVLDLRGNPGGSDDLPIRWCQNFSGGVFGLSLMANLDAAASDPALRWRCLDSNATAFVDGPPYQGHLFVLTDRWVASSGETFVMLTRQIPNALVLGENTAGCLKIGNAKIHEFLSHSGIEMRYGHSRFHNPFYEVYEGKGYLPDYWLDTDDPYPLLLAYEALSN